MSGTVKKSDPGAHLRAREDRPKKKWPTIVRRVLLILIVALAVGMVVFTIFSVTVFDQNDRGIFGFKFFVVQTDSMAATDFKAGDVVISKEVDPETLKPGDIITFISRDGSSYGETITHKIRRLTTDAEGRPAFVTYGTTTNSDDRSPVSYQYIIGKYVGRIPGIGDFFAFIKTPPGYMICIFVPFILLIMYHGFNVIRMFRRYRREQKEEMETERQQLEDERTETMRMLEELRKLQAKLGEQGIDTGSTSTASVEEEPALDNGAEAVADESRNSDS